MVAAHSRKQALTPTRRLGHIERDILEELTLGDFLYSFLLSAHSTKRFYKLARERATARYRRKCALERLIELEYIHTTGDTLSITALGRNTLASAVDRTRGFLQTKKWDGKLRVVTFDIPERYSELRGKVRRILKQAGFQKLHQSVWIFPHDCQELLQLIKDESGLSKYILYGVLDRIEGSGRIVKLFNLPK